MINKIFIYAPNTYEAGGSALLDALFLVKPVAAKIIFMIDRRYVLKNNGDAHQEVIRLKSGIINRLKIEHWFRKTLSSEDLLLCFSGMPPLLKNKSRVVLFVQNILLLRTIAHSPAPLRQKIKYFIKRQLFKCFVKNADKVIVQTETMQTVLHHTVGVLPPISVIPFAAESKEAKYLPQAPYRYDFIYPTTHVPHKNYLNLVKAWVLLAQKGLHPRLCLTLDPHDPADLIQETLQLKERYHLSIDFVGFLSKEALDEHYAKSRACIYPSLNESFGLPLIEARRRGLAVLAGELDYVRDILDPDETFQPLSERSIARAWTKRSKAR